MKRCKYQAVCISRTGSRENLSGRRICDFSGNYLRKNFGDRTEAVKVLFGGIEAENVLSCKDNCIVVEVPEKH